MQKTNWDDLRFVLAVAETGSVSRAAVSLGVNHATVLRRVHDFEQRHGGTVFEKTARGYRTLADKREVIVAAREAEAAMIAVGQLVSGKTSPLQGTVRITSTDTLCQRILPRITADIQARTHDLSVELLCSNAHVDLLRQKVDVTVRPSRDLSDDLVGTQAGVLGFAVYGATNSYDGWLGLVGSLARSEPATWMVENVNPRAINATADSFVTLQDMAAHGLGRAILPCFIGDTDPRLRLILDEMPTFTVPLWVASHADIANTPRLRSIRSALVEGLHGQGAQLTGALSAQS
jgi:DNA-binding transcriptional LysR family regulator